MLNLLLISSCRRPQGPSCRRVLSSCTGEFPSGLHYDPSFFTSKCHNDLVGQSLQLRKKILDSRQASRENAVKVVTSLSKQHNLTTDEYYERVEVKDDKGKTCRGQYFDKYGDQGHELTYFMNNSNVPSFVLNQVVTKLCSKEPIKEVGNPLNWMFTFNAYRPVDDSGVIPGFPFHVDSDFNGDITGIVTLVCPAALELRPKPATNDSQIDDIISNKNSYRTIELEPGSLLLLSGEARWDWQHRVVPGSKDKVANVIKGFENCGVHRMSLVLGCRKR